MDAGVHSHLWFIRHELLRELFSPCNPKQVCVPIGCVPPAWWRIPGRGQVLHPGGVPRGVCLGVVCIQGVCLGGSASRGGLPRGGLTNPPQVCLQGGLHWGVFPTPPRSAHRGICIQGVSASRESLPNPAPRSVYWGGLHLGHLHTVGVCVQEGSAQPPPPRSSYRGGSALPGLPTEGVLHPGGLPNTPRSAHRGFCIRGFCIQRVCLGGSTQLPQVCLKRGVCIWGVGQSPSPLWTEWHTGVKTLPCPKLCLRPVKMGTQSIIELFSSCKSWPNIKCKYVHFVQYNPLFSE